MVRKARRERKKDSAEIEASAAKSTAHGGVVRKFFEDKGFGFIAPNEGGEDIFIHARDLVNTTSLSEGDQVLFDLEWDNRKGNYKSSNCSVKGGWGGYKDEGNRKGKGYSNTAGKDKGSGKGKDKGGAAEPQFAGKIYKDALDDVIKNTMARTADIAPQTLLLLDTLQEKGRAEEACKLLKDSLDGIPRDKISNWRAYIYTLLRRTDEAAYGEMLRGLGKKPLHEKEEDLSSFNFNADAVEFVPRPFNASAAEFVPGFYSHGGVNSYGADVVAGTGTVIPFDPCASPPMAPSQPPNLAHLVGTVTPVMKPSMVGENPLASPASTCADSAHLSSPFSTYTQADQTTGMFFDASESGYVVQNEVPMLPVVAA